LPGAAGAGERDDPHRVGEQPYELPHLADPSDQRVGGDRQVCRVQAANRRELAVAELVDPLRRGQVLQPVLAEVAQPVGADEIPCRLRDQHLPAVADRGDACRAVDVDPDVALLGDQRLAGVETHAHADPARLEPFLAFARGRQPVTRARERDEEGVALRVHLHPAVPFERLAQHPSVLGQRFGVGVAELVQQPRRALDVGEEKCDRAGRQLPHRPILARAGGVLHRPSVLHTRAVESSTARSANSRPLSTCDQQAGARPYDV
jgi:hypothetical protein